MAAPEYHSKPEIDMLVAVFGKQALSMGISHYHQDWWVRKQPGAKTKDRKRVAYKTIAPVDPNRMDIRVEAEVAYEQVTGHGYKDSA